MLSGVIKYDVNMTKKSLFKCRSRFEQKRVIKILTMSALRLYSTSVSRFTYSIVQKLFSKHELKYEIVYKTLIIIILKA